MISPVSLSNDVLQSHEGLGQNIPTRLCLDLFVETVLNKRASFFFLSARVACWTSVVLSGHSSEVGKDPPQLMGS